MRAAACPGETDGNTCDRRVTTLPLHAGAEEHCTHGAMGVSGHFPGTSRNSQTKGCVGGRVRRVEGYRRIAVITVAISAAVSLAGCSSEEATDSSTETSVPSDPVQQISIAFQGSPAVSEVQRLLDNAFAATNTPPTDENYSRAGSVLVTFRKEYGIEEMEILRCIPSRQDDARIAEHSFSNVAAVCVTDLASGG